MNNKVSIRRIIGNVVSKLQLTDVSSSISNMADWATEAEMKIGSRSSYESVECELEVKKFRTCLPAGFVRLKAIKSGGHILDVTNKDFTQFHKGVSFSAIENNSKFIAGNKVLSNPGQPNVHQIDFVPVFQVGDVITISVTNDNCGDATINSFTYIVSPGDGITEIIAEFVNQINIIGGLPYTAVPGSDFFQLIAVNNLINMQVTVHTTSITGAISTQVISRRILPTESSTQEGENCAVVIKEGSENLASKSAALLNDNIYSESSGSNGSNIGGSSSVSKFSIQNGYIHFNAIENGKIGISYWGIMTDEEGWPLVDELHVDAITQYLMWQYEIANFRKGKVSGQYMQWVEQRWYTLCGQARGDSEMVDTQELKYLANMWNQFIPLPNKNKF